MLIFVDYALLWSQTAIQLSLHSLPRDKSVGLLLIKYILHILYFIFISGRLERMPLCVGVIVDPFVR